MARASTRTGSSSTSCTSARSRPQARLRGATERLPYLRDLGVTAIELMPVADFAGTATGATTGVALFAPSRAYGRPDDLRALVDRAHALGIAVLLDVVYNHLGPEGAYLPAFNPDFLTDRPSDAVGRRGESRRRGSARSSAGSSSTTRCTGSTSITPTGCGSTPRMRCSTTVRRRSSRELTRAVHTAPRSASDGRSRRTIAILRRWSKALDGRRLGTRRRLGRRLPPRRPAHARRRYARLLRRLRGDGRGAGATILRQGWLFTGQRSRHRREPRGTDPSGVPMRASSSASRITIRSATAPFGDRLHHTADPGGVARRDHAPAHSRR